MGQQFLQQQPAVSLVARNGVRAFRDKPRFPLIHLEFPAPFERHWHSIICTVVVQVLNAMRQLFSSVKSSGEWNEAYMSHCISQRIEQKSDGIKKARNDEIDFGMPYPLFIG